MKKFNWAATLAVAGLVLTTSAPAFAKKHQAQDAVCSNKSLSKEDKSACKKSFSSAKTANERSKLNKMYKQKAQAAQATAKR